MPAIYRRELRMFFSTSTGYVYLGLFSLAAGLFFTFGALFARSSHFTSYLDNIMFLHFVSTPLLTMRLFTEDRNTNVEQLIFTSPIKVSSVVLGKYFAAATLFLLGVGITVLYAMIVAVHGDITFGETFGAYTGFILLGLCYIALGTFVSALASKQMVAGFLTFFLLLTVSLFGQLRAILSSSPEIDFAALVLVHALIAGLFYANIRIPLLSVSVFGFLVCLSALVLLINSDLYAGLADGILNALSLFDRFVLFRQGILSIADIVYYLSFTAAVLFFTEHLINRRRNV